MTERERLPDRRGSLSFDVEVAGLKYVATVSRFDDGRLAEIFLNASVKVGSGLDDAARDSAVVASLALQYGAPVDVLRKALCRNSDGQATGPLGVALDRIANDGGA